MSVIAAPTEAAPPPQLSAEAVAATLQALVRIDSVNPAYGGPAGGEARVVDWVESFAKRLGLACERYDAMPGRPNLLIAAPGEDSKKTLLFNTHCDVVSIANMSISPMGGEIRDGRLWGRGSTDAKGQLAAMLHALAAIIESGRKPPQTTLILVTVDEEAGFGGIHAAVKHGVKVDAAVVAEPTSLEVVAAHKGTQRWWIEVEGRAAHSAKPHLGLNSIHAAAYLIQAIQEGYAREIANRSHPLLGSPTVNVSMISGGTQVNLVPDRCRILIDRRTLPGETRAIVHAEFERIIDGVSSARPGFRGRQIDPLMVDPPLQTAVDHPIVRAALAVSRKMGRPAEPTGAPYGTDGSKLSEIGIPTIVVGPGSIDQAHTADEFIEIEELAAGARYFHDLMMTRLDS